MTSWRAQISHPQHFDYPGAICQPPACPTQSFQLGVEEATEGPCQETGPRRADLRILIVGSQSADRSRLSQTLTQWGYSVISATNGTEAWVIIQKEQIRFVIAEWTLPDMAGLDLCARVRAAHFPWYTYLLLLTSERREDRVVEGIEAGADGVAMKPLREAELRACMKAGERILSVESHLQEQNQKLSQAYATIRKDLEAAAEVQRSLLPAETLVIPQLQFAWVFRPCAFVAGDFFNYFRLDETHVGFYLLDVAGHGVAAAMQSVTLGKMLSPMPSQSNLVKCYTPHPPYYAITSPEEVVRRLNQQFQAETDTMQYFTIIYGVIDTENDRITLTQAGHPSPIHQNNQAVTLIGWGGFPVGMLPDTEYESEEFEFKPGDRLFLYSDGVTECTNHGDEQFSTTRLVTLIEKQRALPIRDMVQLIKQSLQLWKGDVHLEDDITLLAIERE